MHTKTTLKDVFHSILGCEYVDTPAGKMKDVEVVQEYSFMSKRWPGKHKNVYSWCVLANGKAVGWNESPSRGWSFPVIKYTETK
jgi:hypothetical protein